MQLSCDVTGRSRLILLHANAWGSDQPDVRRSPEFAWRCKGRAFVCVICFLIGPLATLGQTPVETATSVVVRHSRQGMVVSDSSVASQIGRDAMANGGNAVDAAVATAFALAVSWPEAGNIGGGGFMLIHRPINQQDSAADPQESSTFSGPTVCIDYREVAPSSMGATSFHRQDTRFAQKAVGVPGTVRGLALAHAQFGKLDWRQLVMPAADLARNGVPVDQALARSLNGVLQLPQVQSDPKFAELVRVYGKPDQQPWKAGDVLVLPDLAETLTRIADGGPDAFYQGPIADLIVAEMKRGDGEITHEDLSRYRAKIRPAMQGTYRGYTILGPPPPSSGGTCVIEALNILETFDLASRERFDAHTVHLIAEAMRRAMADRAKHLGDPDFVEIPKYLTSKAYARRLARTIDPEHATASASLTPEIEIFAESPQTTHFSVIDRDGMAVSNTYTLEGSWGARIVVPGAGFVLNNEMGDFNWFPGHTDRKGRIGTPANIVAPRKRMLSSQSPTIVLHDGRVVLITGSPGGRSIINTVLCILINQIDYKMTLPDAIAAPRMHHQWFPDVLELERFDEPPHAGIVATLQAMGHQVANRRQQGSAHSIGWDAGRNQWIGVADYRRGGEPATVEQLETVPALVPSGK